MKTLKKDSFINIRPFMVTDLKLKGNSLLIFALIYGITINEGAFYGSIEYMQAWCNASNRNVIDCLKELMKKGLLTKRKSGNTVFYTAKTNFDAKETIDDIPFPEWNESEESSQSSEESSLSSVKKVHLECEESSHNILDNKISNNINNKISEVDTSDFPEDPNEIKTKKTTRSKKPSKTELNEQYISTLSVKESEESQMVSELLISYLKPLQPTMHPETHLRAWQVEFAKFMKDNNISYDSMVRVINFAFTGYWKKCIFAAKNVIENYGKIYQQMTANLKSNYQKRQEETISRVNMNTDKDYTIF